MTQQQNLLFTWPAELPLLPLRDVVVFPSTANAVLVGQERSTKLIADARSGDRFVVVVAQRDAHGAATELSELHRIGTLARVHDVRMTDSSAMHVALQGLERVRLLAVPRRDPYLVGRIEPAPEIREYGMEMEALAGAVRDLFARMVALDIVLPNELIVASRQLEDAREMAYFVASNTPIVVATRQEILEIDSVAAKLRRLVEILQHELAVREVTHRITAETAVDLSKMQRDHILRRHLETIQRELGEGEPEQAELRELKERLAQVPLPEEARKEVDRELERLGRMPTISPEHGMVRSYLDWMLKLPWDKTVGESIDLTRARRVLDEDHYDLDKIKDRIVDYLAVRRLRDARAMGPIDGVPTEPILCFIGPPGVGKTSLGQSIARAMGRKFARVSFGGTHDEGEIRGHRRTYIGAMPGRILQAMARAEAKNPVFMLDEVDKLGVGFHGYSSAALLEVLDPAQNHKFVDNYLGVPFDLSQVLFICTANTPDRIPAPLFDRMEMMELAGYTEDEKVFIAQRHLLRRQLVANGLRAEEIVLPDDAVRRIIRDYTREAGVRNLERDMSTVLRKIARRIGDGQSPPIAVTSSSLPESLGPQRFFAEMAERVDRPGVATGLAWTQAGGGDILFVEATMMPGDEERLILTGMLGDVMRESAQAALSYLRTNASRFGINPVIFERKVVHIHVPVGGIPKDGPSAGVTIMTAVASLALGRPVRNDLAMTGEITLRGKVLPVGGIKEKVLAAHRAGVKTIVLPERNEGALEDVPTEVRRACELVLVGSAAEVLAHALGVQATEPAVAAPPELTESPPSMH